MSALLCFALAAILPKSALLPGAGDLDLATFVATFRRETTWLMWTGIVVSAVAFVLTPVLTIGVPLPAFFLSARLLDKHADAMSEHWLYRLRQASFLLKMMAGLHWGAHPTVRAHFGMAPYARDPGTWRTR